MGARMPTRYEAHNTQSIFFKINTNSQRTKHEPRHPVKPGKNHLQKNTDCWMGVMVEHCVKYKGCPPFAGKSNAIEFYFGWVLQIIMINP